MPTDEQVFEVLREAFPNLEDSHFLIMKETRHSYWDQAVGIFVKREHKKNTE